MSTGKSHRLTLPPVIGELLQRELTLLFGKRAILDLKSLSTEAFYLHVAKQRGHLLFPVQTPNLLTRLAQQYTICSGPNFGPNLHYPGWTSRPNSSASYNCRYVGAATDMPIAKTR